MHNFTEEINVAFNKSLITLAVYTDFLKAFDSVQYPKLLKKLEDIEISPVAFKWLENYLNNRLQRVIANGTHSTYLPVTQGVTQGSVFCSMLFTLMTLLLDLLSVSPFTMPTMLSFLHMVRI